MEVAGQEVEGCVGWCVVGEANLHGLIEKQEVNLVVPTPGVQDGGFGIRGHETGAQFLEKSHEGGAAGTAIEPDGEGRVLGVFARFKEPEKPIYIELSL